jgi:hypothetical protein
VLKVVATIETPTSHQGAARPEVKNSEVLCPARFAKKIAGKNDMAMLAAMIPISSGEKLKPLFIESGMEDPETAFHGLRR